MDSNEKTINNFFHNYKLYWKGKKSNNPIISEIVRNIDKRDLIIFEADFDKLELNSLPKDNTKRELKLPTNNLFIEIPKWVIKTRDAEITNLGGILIFEIDCKNYCKLEGLFHENNIDISKYTPQKMIIVYTLWYIKENEHEWVKPSIISFNDIIPSYSEESNFSMIKSGNSWSNPQTYFNEYMNFDLKIEISEILRKIVYRLITKIEKNEYTTYKKWLPSGFERKEIIYDRIVCSHKRHFWEDSGYFNIPSLGKDEWEKNGYGTSELVFKDGELRRDVPFKYIGSFVHQGVDGKNKENRRIVLAKGKILRKERILHNILLKLFPGEFIKRHDRKAVKPLELDFYIKNLKLAFEYDGEQHFDKRICEEVFGSDFGELQKRDRKKEVMCRKNGIKLIRIKFDEPLGINFIKKKTN